MSKKKTTTHSKQKVGLPDRTDSEPSAFSLVLEKILNRDFLLFTALILFILVYVFSDFFFLKNVYLFKDIGSDSVNGFLPQVSHLADYIRREGFPKWSFNQGLGQNFFAFSLGDPFTWIYVAAGKENIPYLVIFVESAKIFFAGIFFFKFLKCLGLNSFSAVTGGLVFAFSGFMMVGSGWYQFSYEGLCFALLLWGLELFHSRKIPALIPLAIALIGAYQPFNLYLAALLSGGYFLFRHLLSEQFVYKKFFAEGLFIVILFILGTGLSSVFLFSNLEQVLQSPRGTGEASYFHILSSKPVFEFAEPIQYISLLMRTFSSDLLGNGSNFKGWQNYLESPLTYCGLASLILTPLYFSFADKKKKKVLVVLVIICLIPVVFPYFRYAFWLFSGDYYRSFSFFISTVLILFAVGSLNHLTNGKRLNLKYLGGSVLFLMLILYYPSPDKDHILKEDLRGEITLFLIGYFLVVWMMSVKRYAEFAKILFLLLLVSELCALSSSSIHTRTAIPVQELKEKKGYTDFTLEALDYIHSQDTSFYRIIKDYSSGPAVHGSLNDGKMQGYYGTSAYTSFAQQSYIHFLEDMKFIEPGNEIQTRWTQGLATRLLPQSFASVRYYLLKNNISQVKNMGYDSLTTIGGVSVAKNRFALPLGYAYTNYIPKEEFSKLSVPVKDKVILQALVTSDNKGLEGMKHLPMTDTSAVLSFQYYRALIDSLKKDTLHITRHRQNNIEGTITLSEKKILFFTIPFDKGWHATVNGAPEELLPFTIGFMGLPLEKGTYTIALNYEPPYLKSGAWVSGISLLAFCGVVFLGRKIITITT